MHELLGSDPFSTMSDMGKRDCTVFPAGCQSATLHAWICNQVKLFAHSDLLTSFLLQMIVGFVSFHLLPM